MLKWEKVPSVGTGGRQFFWHIRIGGKPFWVATDWTTGKWKVTTENPTGRYELLGTFNTAEAGKKFVKGMLTYKSNPKFKKNISFEQSIEVVVTRLAKKGYDKDKIVKYLRGKYGLSKDDAEDFAKAEGGIEKGKYKPDWMKNPPRNKVEIYDKIITIQAQKGKRSIFPKEYFKHNFQKDKTSASIYGLPDGSLLVKSKRGKKLWKKFEYD